MAEVLLAWNPDKQRNADPAGAIRQVTPAAADLPDGVCRALWAGTAGTATLVDATGQTLTDFPLVQGPNPIAVKQVVSLGTAADVWALYSTTTQN